MTEFWPIGSALLPIGSAKKWLLDLSFLLWLGRKKRGFCLRLKTENKGALGLGFQNESK
jgi:hypothetical protein